MGLKRGGAEREFETHLLKFETYLVLRDYETEKTTGAPAPAAPASLAPMYILEQQGNLFVSNLHGLPSALAEYLPTYFE